jgi:hypothetical protein
MCLTEWRLHANCGYCEVQACHCHMHIVQWYIHDTIALLKFCLLWLLSLTEHVPALCMCHSHFSPQASFYVFLNKNLLLQLIISPKGIYSWQFNCLLLFKLSVQPAVTYSLEYEFYIILLHAQGAWNLQTPRELTNVLTPQSAWEQFTVFSETFFILKWDCNRRVVTRK